MHRKSYIWAALLVLVVALIATGCEDGAVTAPGDGTLVLTVDPGTITFDPSGSDPDSAGEALVLARVFDAEGAPVEGVAVTFAATGGGILAVNCDQPDNRLRTSVSTNANGVAEACLVVPSNLVSDADPTEELTVQASASALADDEVVIVRRLADDERARASISTDPRDRAAPNEVVTFDGSQSIDTDGTITWYRWTIESSLGTTEIVQGPNAQGLTRRYTSLQHLDVALEVSDDPAAAALYEPEACGPLDGSVPVGTSTAECRIPIDDIEIVNYDIVDPSQVCTNTAPTASAGPDQAVSFLSNPTDVVVDGTNSFDQDGRIERYNFSCGNGTEPQNTDSVSTGIAVCRYNQAGTYTITLTVRDNGNGVLGNNGEYGCVAFDEDTAIVTLTRPQ